MYDSRNDNYVLYHSALLVFVLTVMIPANLHLTKLSVPITAVLFAVGFLSLFMIARNDKVGLGLLHSVRIVQKRSPRSSRNFRMYYDHPPLEKVQHSLDSTDIHQDPLVLLQNFIDELSKRHQEVMDLTTLDSFRNFRVRVSQLVEANTNDE